MMETKQNTPGLVQPHVLLDTHRAVKAYAALAGLDLPTAYKILVDTGLDNMGMNLLRTGKSSGNTIR